MEAEAEKSLKSYGGERAGLLGKGVGAGETKIGELGNAVPSDDDILALKVAVHDALTVKEGDALGNPECDGDPLAPGHVGIPGEVVEVTLALAELGD